MTDDDRKETWSCREELPDHLRDHTFFRNYPTRAEMAAFTKKKIRELYNIPDDVPDSEMRLPTIKAENREQADAIRVEEIAADQEATIKSKASAWARGFLNTLTLDERIAASAPPKRKGKRGPKSSVFSWRYPTQSERHELAAEYTGGKGGWQAYIQRTDLPPGNAQHLKAELTIVRLLNDETLHWNAISDRGDKQPSDDNVVTGAILRTFWRAHDESLSAAERQGIWRDNAITCAPGKPVLCADILGALTRLKTDGGTVLARALLKLIGAGNAEFRKEVLGQ